MTGIDVRIEELRSFLESKLWTSNDVTFYGRIFRQIKNGGIVPMNFVAPIDYQDVLTDDMKDGICFFDVQPNEDYECQFQADVWVQFALNLAELYPTETAAGERATEYAHRDVIKYISRKWGDNSITGLVRNITAFDDYTGVKPTDDYQPFYIFRINTTIKYPINC